MALKQKMARRVRRVQRKARAPVYDFYVKQNLFQIQPVGCFKVLPNETLKSLSLLGFARSELVKDSHMGCYMELYSFYVKNRQLGDEFISMIEDPDYDQSGLHETADDLPMFFKASVSNPGINYVRRTLNVVVEAWFRGGRRQSAGSALWNNVPIAGLRGQDFLSSLADPVTDDTDVDVDLDADSTITAAEVEEAIAKWKALRERGMVDLDYDNFLRSHGISRPHEAADVPELLGQRTFWTMPRRLVDPADGDYVAEWLYNPSVTFSEAKRFNEPGFVLTVAVFRPKLYRSTVTRPLFCDDKEQRDFPTGEELATGAYHLKEFAAGTGPLDGTTTAYQLDVTDELRYGGQFVNQAPTALDHTTPHPPADVDPVDYPGGGGIQNAFVDTTTPKDFFTFEGTIRPVILSQLPKDMTERTE